MKFGQIFRSGSLGHHANAHSHSQPPVPLTVTHSGGDFLLWMARVQLNCVHLNVTQIFILYRTLN